MYERAARPASSGAAPSDAVAPLGRAGDAAEREAERAADDAVHARPARVATTPDAGGQAATVGPLGAGVPLDPAARAAFEPRFGHSFADVRVHAGDHAAAAASRLRAQAFTRGNDIAFGADRYEPHTASGQRLLAHELAHVVQQHGLANAPVQRTPDDEPPRPATPEPARRAFNDLPDGERVADPTGRAHGITVERRGNELYYHLPAPINATRQVPRPLDTISDPPVDETIAAVRWGGYPGSEPFQIAFSVEFSSLLSPSYSVNIHGLGTYQSLTSMLLRQPGDLEVQPAGLELERQPDVLTQRRPRPARFRDARRYHMPGAPYSMYVFPDRRIEVADDARGTRLGGPWRDVEDLRVTRAGDVSLVWGTGRRQAATFNLRDPTFKLHAAAVPEQTARRTELLANLRGLGITITERGSQFTEIELQAAWDLLQKWRGPTGVVESLRAQGAPGLTFIKDVLISGGSYNTDTGELKISGEMEATPEEARNTIIHELTHALYHARGLRVPETGPMPAEVTDEAEHLRLLAEAGAIDEGAVRTRRRAADARTQEQWERALSSDTELSRLWGMLHRRFRIGDPEGTADIRGLDVADESRYQPTARGDPVGHAFDNVSEFISSFVTSTLNYQAEMTRTVERGGDPLLAILYRDLWARVDDRLIDLGTQNPWQAVITRLQPRPAAPAAPAEPAPSGLRLRHGPRLELGAEFAPGGQRALGALGYDVLAEWSRWTFTAGLRLDVPFTSREAFVRAGLNVGANLRLLENLYGRVYGGVTVPIREDAGAGLQLGAGLGYDFGRVQLEALYDVLRPASADERVHRLMLGVGFRFGD